jgi:hypothetical protein
LQQFARERPGRRIERLHGVRIEPFNVERIGETCASLEAHTSTLRAISVSGFVVYFVIFPGLLLVAGLRATLVALIPAVILLSVLAAVWYHRAARRLLPFTPKVDLYGNIVRLVLFPISTLRCTDLISYRLLSIYDPIAVAMVLRGKDDAGKLATREMLALRYGSASALDEPACAAITEYRQVRLSLLERFCSQRQLPVASWDSQPNADNPSCLTYCPCCGVQYMLSEGFCADCADIVLQPLKPTR